MRNITLAVFVIFTIIFLSVGCGVGHEGKYVNSNNSSEYIELKSGGNFFSQESGVGFTGKWEVKGDSLILTLPIGLSVSVKIENGHISDNYGKTWIKK